MPSHLTLKTNYDDIADTLYVTSGECTVSRYREDREYEGLIWRLDAAGHEFGVTILDFEEWTENFATLSGLIARHLGQDPKAVKKALSAVG